MNFFKKLFSSGKDDAADKSSSNSADSNTQVKEIFSDEAFKKRFELQDIHSSPVILDFAFKMIESYYVDNKISKKVPEPLNHPDNLDQIASEGVGFHMYCKALQMKDSETLILTAHAFAEYMIKNYGFKLYKDLQPEDPFRAMTIKHEKDRAVMTLYPMDYAVKVLRNEATFAELVMNVEKSFKKMPTVEGFLNNLEGNS